MANTMDKQMILLLVSPDFAQVAGQLIESLRSGQRVISKSAFESLKESVQKQVLEVLKTNKLDPAKVIAEGKKGFGEGENRELFVKNFPAMAKKVSEFETAVEAINKVCKDNKWNLAVQIAWKRNNTEKPVLPATK